MYLEAQRSLDPRVWDPHRILMSKVFTQLQPNLDIVGDYYSLHRHRRACKIYKEIEVTNSTLSPVPTGNLAKLAMTMNLVVDSLCPEFH